MNSRERVLTALEHKEPDQVPIQASFTPETAKRLENYLGLNKTEAKTLHSGGYDLDIEMGVDILQTAVGVAANYYLEGEEYVDEWGITWKRIYYETRYGRGSYTEMIGHPLECDDAVDRYEPPNPYDEKNYTQIKKLMDVYGKDYAILGAVVATVFESAWYLRGGLDKLLMDFVLNEDLANRILDIPMNYHLEAGRNLIELGCDIIWTGDDVGMQSNMIMSVEMWRKFLKPRMEKIFSEFKKINRNVKIAYHSDGNIGPIIDDLVEIGMDILNPLQPQALTISNLKKRYGKKLSFWGGIDIQKTLPYGTIEDIENEVKGRIKELGLGGGYILSPAHHIQLDTSIENIMAFFEAAKKYGKYPIKNLLTF
jgi:uroporphyrinogen decarboxylase